MITTEKTSLKSQEITTINYPGIEIVKNAVRKNHNKTNQLKNAIGLFSGGGGLDLGFSAAGFNVRVSNDNDIFSCKTLELNNGRRDFYNHAVSLHADILKISAQELLENANLKKNEVDLLIGGPPCQAYSVFGKRMGISDPRGELVWEYLRILEEIKPKVFVFENVSGLQSIHEGLLYKEIIQLLELNGLYTVSAHRYQLADFGIPQFRDRIFLIGTTTGVIVPEMQPTHGDFNTDLIPYRTSFEALRFLPKPSKLGSFPNHSGRKHSQRIIDRYHDLKFGERDAKTRINKLNPEKPSFTIIVGSDKGGGKGHVHPFEPREVTPRESARMQTFPDWWEFYGTGRHVIRQVGNAVPPLFAAQLAEHINIHVFNTKKRRSYDDLIRILDLGYLEK